MLTAALMLLGLALQAPSKPAALDPSPKAGETILLVNDHGSETVGVIYRGKIERVPNPTRARVVDGKGRPKGDTRIFDVELLEGDNKGLKVAAAESAMRRPDPTAKAKSKARPRRKRYRQTGDGTGP